MQCDIAFFVESNRWAFMVRSLVSSAFLSSHYSSSSSFFSSFSFYCLRNSVRLLLLFSFSCYLWSTPTSSHCMPVPPSFSVSVSPIDSSFSSSAFTFTTYSIGVNPGGFGGRDPQIFGWGSWEVLGVSWTGLGKHYSLFWTESTLENVFYKIKRQIS